MPTFSIIITCYNYGRYLEKSISSVLDQKRDDVEIIVVDDCSDDETVDVAKKLEHHIKYIRLDKNQGPAFAWETGIRASEGSFLCKLDADDWQMPGFLDTAYDQITFDDSIGMFACSVRTVTDEEIWGDELITRYDVTLEPEELRKRLLEDFFVYMPGTCLRREVLSSTAGPIKELFQGHDWELFLRGLEGWRAVLFRKPLAVYRLHRQSVTTRSIHTGGIVKDFNYWLERASENGPYFVKNEDREVLAGSMAILVIRSVSTNFGLSSIFHTIYMYMSAFLLGIRGSTKQLIRVMNFLLIKMIVIMKRKLKSIIYR